MWNLKRAKFIEIESKIVVAWGWWWGKWEMLVKVHKLPAIRLINSKNLMYNMVTIINNTVLYIWKLRKLEICGNHIVSHLKCDYNNNKKKLVMTWGDGDVSKLYFYNHFTIYTCVKSSGCIPKLTYVVHQQYLNKPGKTYSFSKATK